jgi:hypothetical protein
MNIEEAKKFVVAQGIGPDGLTVQARMGTDPGAAVFDQLIVALRELTTSLADQDLIEKELALALFSLAAHVPSQYETWSSRGITFRSELMGSDIYRLPCAVESVFVGEWIECEK